MKPVGLTGRIWNGHTEVHRFFKLMIQFRKAHPSISRSQFWRKDIHWYGTEHAVDLSHDSRQLAYCLHGASQNDDDLYVIINLGTEGRDFGIHEGLPNEWRQVIDTAETSPKDILSSIDTPPFYTFLHRPTSLDCRPHSQSINNPFQTKCAQ